MGWRPPASLTGGQETATEESTEQLAHAAPNTWNEVTGGAAVTYAEGPPASKQRRLVCHAGEGGLAVQWVCR